ncbi:hypothetical protein FOMG_17099 [Fusarium oxysporum f. sp. melonis 26406]|uniref:Uncharacterized protein n=1 Tax=Fusarium oxysporum f. sp. melonis 26406 TaxID=1089452 RepID=W9ZCG6_FUSOX|nr:hypothetical protein FOMG_17099 [Fusarium oxysporum f. sp. melonis 26406]KAK2470660.1 hypothetical protein H9L39_16891 [Fusarium oxysporum f. sp. albedinis]
MASSVRFKDFVYGGNAGLSLKSSDWSGFLDGDAASGSDVDLHVSGLVGEAVRDPLSDAVDALGGWSGMSWSPWFAAV